MYLAGSEFDHNLIDYNIRFWIKSYKEAGSGLGLELCSHRYTENWLVGILANVFVEEITKLPTNIKKFESIHSYFIERVSKRYLKDDNLTEQIKNAIARILLGKMDPNIALAIIDDNKDTEREPNLFDYYNKTLNVVRIMQFFPPEYRYKFLHLLGADRLNKIIGPDESLTHKKLIVSKLIKKMEDVDAFLNLLRIGKDTPEYEIITQEVLYGTEAKGRKRKKDQEEKKEERRTSRKKDRPSPS